MSYPKIVEIEEFGKYLHDGVSVIMGGFGMSGTPFALQDYLAEHPCKGIEFISQSAVFPGCKLLEAAKTGKIAMYRTSSLPREYFRTDLFQQGKIKAEILSQGTFAERERAGGFGLGGVLTPVGLGTELAEGKQIIKVDGKDYLLEKPLHAEVGCVHATKADKFGNLVFNTASKNFCIPICFACDTLFVEVEEIVEVGELTPDEIDVPGIVVDFMIKADPTPLDTDIREYDEASLDIARRAEKFFKDGDVVNLGVGIPTQILRFRDPNKKVAYQSENGILWHDKQNPVDGNPKLVDAQGVCVDILPGASVIDSATSFGMIRGGFMDYTVLGTYQVAENGLMSNWKIPGKRMNGPGGAMELLYGAKKVIVCMKHTDNQGRPKLVKEVQLPINSIRPIDYVVTDLCTLKHVEGGFELMELVDGVTIEELKAKTEANLIIPERFYK